MINVLKTTTVLFVSGTIAMDSFADTPNPYAEAIERFTKSCGEPSAFEQMKSYLDDANQTGLCDPQRLISLRAKYRDYDFIKSEEDDILYRRKRDSDSTASNNVDSLLKGLPVNDLKQHSTESETFRDSSLPILRGYTTK